MSESTWVSFEEGLDKKRQYVCVIVPLNVSKKTNLLDIYLVN